MPLALEPLPDTIRLLRDDEVARLRLRYPRLPSTPEDDCVTCRGTGRYRWYAPGSRTEVVEWTCNCDDQFVLHRALLNANVGLTYQRLGWDDMGAAEPKALDTAKTYLEHAPAYTSAGIGLIFFGERGTGKTALSTLLVKGLLAQGHDCYFTTFSEMIDTYTGGWNDRDEKVWFHKRIKNAGILVLDDVGKEYQGRAKNGLPESTFDEVLRHRLAGSVPTIITTNHDMKRLTEGYGGGVMSLLHERSSTYRFDGDDFRDHARNRVLDEVEAGLTRPLVLR